MELFRAIVPVLDIEAAARFYGTLLGSAGERVTGGRHYFDCGGVLLACLDPVADGDPEPRSPNGGHCYFATGEDLDAVRARVVAAGAVPDPDRGEVAVRPWGERSFYASDPWGNPFAVVEAGTEYTGDPFHWPG